MGRPREWPAEVERAVLTEVLAGGRTVKDVIHRLHLGILPGVEGAYKVPRTTVYRWVDEAKRAYDEAERPDALALDDAAARLWRLHLLQLDELEALQRKAKRSYQEDRLLDYGLRAALKRQTELERLQSKPPEKAKPSANRNGSAEEEHEPDFLDSIDEGQAQATTGSPAPEPSSTDPDDQRDGDVESATAVAPSASSDSEH